MIQLHMQPSGAEERVQPSIGFFFSDTRPSRTPTILRSGRKVSTSHPASQPHRQRFGIEPPVDVELASYTRTIDLRQARGFAGAARRGDAR